jgi:hypothetical protein
MPPGMIEAWLCIVYDPPALKKAKNLQILRYECASVHIKSSGRCGVAKIGQQEKNIPVRPVVLQIFIYKKLTLKK